MKNFLRFFRPNTFIIVYSSIGLAWQYLYNFPQTSYWHFDFLRNSLAVFSGTINWDHPVIRSVFWGVIWLAVAFVIFSFMIFSEMVSIFFHNRKIKAQYINQPREDFEHLLRVREISFKIHFPIYLAVSAGLVFCYFGLFYFAELLEKIRFSFLEEFYFYLVKAIWKIEAGNSLPLFISFFSCFLFWCFFSLIPNYFFLLARKLKEREIITEEHYGAVIET